MVANCYLVLRLAILIARVRYPRWTFLPQGLELPAGDNDCYSDVFHDICAPNMPADGVAVRHVSEPIRERETYKSVNSLATLSLESASLTSGRPQIRPFPVDDNKVQ